MLVKEGGISTVFEIGRGELVRGAERIGNGGSYFASPVCGDGKKFHNAKAAINGNTVVVTCDAVPNIVAVRYGWADHPICNLFNQEGLPASPFRTDDFPGITKK